MSSPVTMDTDTCPVTMDTDTCPVTTDTDTCPVTMDTDTCPATMDTDTCPVTTDTDTCPVTMDTDTCPVTMDTDTCPVTTDTDTCSVTMDTDTCAVPVGACKRKEEKPAACPQAEFLAALVDSPQQVLLFVAAVNQLSPHAVVDVEQVVRVLLGIAHHLLWERSATTHSTCHTNTAIHGLQ